VDFSNFFRENLKKEKGKLVERKREVIFFLIVTVAPAFILFTIFYLLPIVTLIVTSFFKWDSMKIGGFIGFKNYIKMFGDPIFHQALRNNLSWSLCATFLHIPFALGVALILYTRPKGWKIFRTVYFLPHIISITAFAVIFRSVFNPSFGLLNAILGALGIEKYSTMNWFYNEFWAWKVIISTWLFHIGLLTMIFLAKITEIPVELYEAARIDGASSTKQAWYITIPLLRHVIGLCSILTVAGGLRYFEGLYIMTNGAPNWKTEILALYIYQQVTLLHYSYANTLGVALLVIGFLVILMFVKSFRIGEE